MSTKSISYDALGAESASPHSYIRFQQFNFGWGQVEQGVDLGVDFALQPGNFGAERVYLGARGGDPVFPFAALFERDIGLQRLFHFALKSGEIGQCPPFLEPGGELGAGRIGGKVRDAPGDRLLQAVALFGGGLRGFGQIA